MFLTYKNAQERYASEDGAVTTEFVVLFPALLVLTTAMMDVGFMYYQKSQIHSAVQSVTRARSIGEITKNDDARIELETKLAEGFSDEAIATVTLTDDNMISTSVTVPLHDMQLVGFFSRLIGDPDIIVGDQQFYESFDLAAVDLPTTTGSDDTTMIDGILDEAVEEVLDPITDPITPPDGIY